jgi:AraC family transcriptional regulator
MVEEPRIKTLSTIRLIGQKRRMSVANNQTKELWQTFMPQKGTIRHSIDNHLYSLEVYDSTDYVRSYDPTKECDKWAAIAVSEFTSVPEDMAVLVLPEGRYAVFSYKGKASDAPQVYQYIYGEWLPKSEYELDDRPHFALMGDKYKGDDPDSEEEIWIPVR